MQASGIYCVNLVTVSSNYKHMNSESTSKTLQKAVPLLEENKNSFAKLGIDFKMHGDLLTAMSVIGAMQREIKASFDKLDQKTLIYENVIDQQLERCVKCADKNHQLLLRVLQIKEELICRM